MAEKLADLKISVDIEKKDDLLLFGDAIGNIEKRVWTTSEAMVFLKAQVEEYQNKVDKAKVGTQEWQDANLKLKASQEELAHALSSEGRREMTLARQEADKFAESEKKATRATKEFSRSIKRAVVFLGQYLAVKKTFSAVMGFAAEGEQLARMAQLSGTSAEAIQKLGIALKNYGGSASSASSVLGKLNKQMEDLKFGKGGKLGQAAIRYGLNINAQTPEDMLRNIAKRMEGMGALQQVNMGRMLGLDDATIMFLQQGLKGVNRELERAGSLTVFSKEDIENTQKVQRAYREFQERFEQLKATMTRDLLPVFQTLFERLGKLADYLKEHPKLFKALGVTAAVVFGGLLLWAYPLVGGIALISGAIVALWDDFKTFQEGGKSLINWDNPFLRFFRELLDVISKCTQAVGGFIAAAKILLTGGSFEDAWNALKGSVDESHSPDFNGATITKEDADRFWSEQNIKDVPFKGRTFGHRVSSVELGQAYVAQANATPLNQMTSTQMSIMNSNTQSQEKQTIWNVGNVTVNQKNNETAQQTLIDWTSQANPAY